MDIYESLNSILVTLFNDIMNIEEKALITDEFKDISVTDMHIIEAVGIGEPRTMGVISKALGVTMGTLTVGINGLVKKGYVIRTRGEKTAVLYMHHSLIKVLLHITITRSSTRI